MAYLVPVALPGPRSKYGLSELRCAIIIRYTTDFKDLGFKKECKIDQQFLK